MAWDDLPKDFNETTFIIYRSSLDQNEYKTWNIIGQTEANILNFSDKGFSFSSNQTVLSPNTVYEYKVAAYFNGATTQYSNQVSGSYTCESITSLTAKAVDCNLMLNWSDIPNTSLPHEFSIFRSSDGGSYNFLTNVGSNVFYYIDYNNESGINYSYKIKAKFENAYSDFSNAANATINCYPAPTNFRITNTGCGKISLAWDDNTPSINEIGYFIYRSTTESNGYYLIGQTNNNSLTFIDNFEIRSGTTYYYKIQGYINYLQSAKSSPISASFDCYPAVTLSLISADCNGVKISWTDFPSNFQESQYYIYRKEENTNYDQLAGQTTENTFYDKGNYNGLKAGVNYIYTVVGTFGGNNSLQGDMGLSPASNGIIAKINCSGPNIISNEILNCSALKLNWQPSENQGDPNLEYQIYRSDEGLNGSYYLIGTNITNNFIDKRNLGLGKSYFYKVKLKSIQNYTNLLSDFGTSFTGTLPINLSTVKSGLWTDPTTWSCERIPTLVDEVIINPTHQVTVGENVIGNAKNVKNNGVIILLNGAIMKLNTP